MEPANDAASRPLLDGGDYDDEQSAGDSLQSGGNESSSAFGVRRGSQIQGINTESNAISIPMDGILLKNVVRSYGSHAVLRDINLHCARGSIYGLLGPSGCGKTTLLKIVLGRLIPDAGTVNILGNPPLTPGSGVPGRRVGYAPQETALYNDLSVSETLAFHATMNGVIPSGELYRERIRWIKDLLELPDLDGIVGKLSGGQQRRVSLAVALLHGPELLVLDEPTVGLDPLLRMRIWHYLRVLTDGGVTVLVTTHYIEEARQADMVGLMRNGTLLAEGQPEALMARHGYNTLEDVFLMLCRNFEREQRKTTVPVISDDASPLETVSPTQSIVGDDNLATVNHTLLQPSRGTFRRKKSGISGTTSYQSRLSIITDDNDSAVRKSHGWGRHILQVLAISRRKLTQLRRNYAALLFETLIPAIQFFLFIVCIGGTPTDLPFGVVNHDMGVPSFDLSLGNSIYASLKDSQSLRILDFPSSDDAHAAIRSGDVWGAMVIPPLFSQGVFELVLSQNDSTLNHNPLEISMDFSNYQVTLVIEQNLLEAFESVGQEYACKPRGVLSTAAAIRFPATFSRVSSIRMRQKDSNSRRSNVLLDEKQPYFDVSSACKIEPIKETAIYGTTGAKFVTFLVPGMVTLITFAHTIGMTSIAFVREKKDVTLDRIYAAGVSPIKIILGHFLTHLVVVVVQTILMLITAFVMFDVEVKGSIPGVFGALLLLGAVGMSAGLLISTVANDETEAVQFSLAMFFPALLLSGVMWPIEAIPAWLKWLSYSLPTTWMAETVRSIMLRGWGITAKHVWMGPVVSAAWVIVLLLCSLVLLRPTERQSTWRRNRALQESRGLLSSRGSQFKLGLLLGSLFGLFALCALPRIDHRRSFLRGIAGPAIVWIIGGVVAFFIFVAGAGGLFPSQLT